MGGVLQKRFEAILGGPLEWKSRPVPETVPTGVPEVDLSTGGLPRGCLTEIYGPASSGRTALLFSILAEATGRGETCAVVDAEDAFDPASAAAAGVRLERLLWARCAHSAEHALRAADLLIQGGGFGLVAMDLADTPPETARRISLTSWFRLRRAVENTPAVLLAVARQSNAKTCASLMLECGAEGKGEFRRCLPAIDGCISTLAKGSEPRQEEDGRFVSGHGFSRADRGEDPWALAPVAAGAKAQEWGRLSARLKPCPDTNHRPDALITPDAGTNNALFSGFRVRVTRRKPGRVMESRFYARALE